MRTYFSIIFLSNALLLNAIAGELPPKPGVADIVKASTQAD